MTAEIRELFEGHPTASRATDGSGAVRIDCPVAYNGHAAYLHPGDEVDCESGHPADVVVASLRRSRPLLEAAANEGPPECRIQHPYGYDRSQCLVCVMRREWVRERVRRVLEESEADGASQRVDGSWLFGLPTVAPLWGNPDAPLAAEGQGWMIVGPDGTGKTSTACQYVKARLGLPGWAGEMWDLPVVPLPPEESVYYLAMDRSRQMAEAFMRGVGEEHRAELTRRLFIHRGPPAYRLGGDRGQQWIVDEVNETRAGLVVLDSRKDAGSTLDHRDVTGVAIAIQLLVNAGVEVLVLAHPVKDRRNGPPSLEDVSGLREVFSGLGSVVFLDGRPGSQQVEVYHRKPIRELVPPFKIEHDHPAGRSTRLVGIVLDPDGNLTEGRAPVDSFEIRALACIDANRGEAPSASMKEVLKSDNLSRDLKRLIERKVIEHNGLRGPQAGYRRGPEAPPR